MARFDLQLTEEEFGELTPGLFEALVTRKQAADKADYARAGIVAAAVINHSMSPPEKAVHPLDFVPGESKKDREAFDLSSMTPEAQAKAVKGMFTRKKFRRRS